MTKAEVQQRILDIGIVPVVRAPSGPDAIRAAEAVCAGGVPVVELTMTVPGAIEVIAQLAKGMSQEVLIGAGTVLDAESARRCLDAGAQFLVSPGFDSATVELAKNAGALIMSGALTPTEVITAWKAGVGLVKIFPCGNLGGPKYIKALKAPLPQVLMVPTGGINLDTAADFLRAGSAALGIGGELISASALKSGNLKTITDAARQYVSIVKQTRHEMSANPA